MYGWSGWGTFVCQDCRGRKKVRNSKRCKPCNYKSKEWAEIQRERQTKRYEDPLERTKDAEARKKSPVFQAALKSKERREKLSRGLKLRFEDPKERAKQSKAMKKHYEDPEARRKAGEASRRAWMKRKQVGGDHGPTR